MHLTQSGTSLIEILVSLTLLSVLILNLDVMQLQSIREVKSAYYFAMASQEINVLLQRLEIAKNKTRVIEQWNKELLTHLPNGHGIIFGNYPQLTISVLWGEQSGKSCTHTQIGVTGCVKWEGK